MNRMQLLGRNLKYFFAREWAAQAEEQDQKLHERVAELEQRQEARANDYEQAFDERLSRYEQALDQRAEAIQQAFNERADHFEQGVSQRLDGYERAVDQRLDEREAALKLWLDERHAAIDLRLDERENLVDKRLDGFETALTERATAFEKTTSEALGAFTTATTARLNERDAAIDERLAAREKLMDERFDERFTQIETRLDERLAAQEQVADARAANFETALDQRFDERFVAVEKASDERAAKLEIRLDQRFDERFIALEKLSDERTEKFEIHLDHRLDERFSALEQRGDERLGKLEQTSEARLNELMHNFELRFDERTRATDTHADQRLNQIERHLDERLIRLERTSDERMETHERRVDGKLKTNREDLVDRTDVMLQLFEQRLDQQRRALRHLREHSASTSAPSTQADTPLPELAEVLQETPQGQTLSFRKLAEGYHPLPVGKLPKAETALYHRILDWKKVAHEGLNDFTTDEQEVADYILSFIGDSAERHYTMQHMRRFLDTLERIPPPQSSADRLLELGSLSHFVPALKKFTGYNHIDGADFWESDERVSTETLIQINGQIKGKETLTFELTNFNVEADAFPYPDQHFRVVLCCELIEHLQRDPLHMLWECNRVLQDGGYLLLTTPNIACARSIEGLLISCSPYLLSQYNLETPADQHNHEYAPYEVGVAIAAAGFTVVALETSDVWLRSNPAILELLAQLEISTDLRGDNIFALARKTSAPVERYPKELYVP